jgi:hypothetical protein
LNHYSVASRKVRVRNDHRVRVVFSSFSAHPFRDGILNMRIDLRCIRFVCLLVGIAVQFGGKSSQKAVAISLPVAGINPIGYSYYGTALPFVDVAHMSGRWLSVAEGVAAGASIPQAVQVNATDYPSSLAPGQIARTLLFTNNGQVYPLGQYVLQWQGNGSVQLGGSGVSTTSSSGQQVVYNVTSKNDSGLYLDVTKTDPANPVRNISLRAPFTLTGSGTFNPDFQKDIAGYGVLRFMGWNATNNQTTSSWSLRSTPATFHWGGYNGVPYESQIQLSNELREDLWINVPHLADDDYVRNLAQLVQQKLAVGLRVWVEYSNEVWNGSFPQAAYANDVLRPKYGFATSAEAYGRRSAEIFDIFSAQISNPTTRLVRVIAAQNANSSVLTQSLKGATVNGQLKADVAAIAPYFSVDTDQLYQRYLQGTVDLNSVFTDLHSAVDTTMQMAADNQRIAAANGLPLVSYEGGQHLIARPGEAQNDDGFVALLSQINRDDRIGALYTYMLDEWTKVGGKTFTLAGDIYPSGKWGSWGLQECYLDTNAAKYKAVLQYLQRLKATNVTDFNKDGATNILDYYDWRLNYGSTQLLNADGNRNGIVDSGDYVLLRKVVSQQNAIIASQLSGSVVPEPRALVLAIGALSIGFFEFRWLQSRMY